MPSIIRHIRPVATDAILIEVESASDVQRLRSWVLDQAMVADCQEVIPGARTLYLLGTHEALSWFRRTIPDVDLPEVPTRRSRRVRVLVRYDGLDLAEVADRTGLSVAQVIDAHTGAEYRVDFFGFSPGQAFFSGVPPALHLPRRSSPRTRVPVGSVAIANEYCIIYPDGSPGGWNLLGTRVGDPLWDTESDPPNRVDVGDTVIFQAVS